MKLISILDKDIEKLAFYLEDKCYIANEISQDLPASMQEYLDNWEKYKDLMLENYAYLQENNRGISWRSPSDVTILSPLPFPKSFRDAYAFRQHVEAGRRNRGLEMIAAFDEFPVFYFSNHNVFSGPGTIYLLEDHFNKLDYELEIAIIIGKKGKNIRANEADDYIAGYMILNDWSARTLQREEMQLNLGPAKGKDFATTAGPILVSPESLKAYKTNPLPGHVGNAYDLEMTAKVNGELLSRGNFKDMDWTFAEIIERCSYGVTLYPGDVIGSGTVGTGCLLELNGTKLRENPNAKETWIKPEDEVELSIQELGSLKNTIKKEEAKYSLFQIKK